MKKTALIISALILTINLSAQSSWGILGKIAGEIIEGTSNNNDWRTVGKALQTAGDMQYELDKIRVKNNHNINYNINSTQQSNVSIAKIDIPEHVIIVNGKYQPEEGYGWVDTFSPNNLSVKKKNPSIEEEVNQFNNTAQLAFENENFSEAIIYSTKSINLSPNPGGYFFRIVTNYTLKNFKECKKDLDLLLNYIPEEYFNEMFIVFWEFSGLIEMSENNLEQALYSYTKALEINCSSDYNDIKAEIYSNRANCKVGMGDYDGALKDCDKSILLNSSQSNRVLVLNVKGTVSISKEDYNNALVYFNEAIENCSYHVMMKHLPPVLYTNKALAEYLIKDYMSSLKSTNKALEYDQNYYKAYYVRGLSKIELGLISSSCNDFKIASQNGIEDSNSYINIHCK